MKASHIVDSVTTHIGNFGLKLNGASVMKKFGQSLSCEHQLCYAHGIHLAVFDVLYSTRTPVEEAMESEDDVDRRELLPASCRRKLGPF